MTITTDMRLAAGCRLGQNYVNNLRCVVDAAYDLNDNVVARKFGERWIYNPPNTKPRFRVKAKSRPYIPATMFGPGDDGPEWVTGDRYIYTARVPIPADFTVFGGLAK